MEEDEDATAREARDREIGEGSSEAEGVMPRVDLPVGHRVSPWSSDVQRDGVRPEEGPAPSRASSTLSSVVVQLAAVVSQSVGPSNAARSDRSPSHRMRDIAE